VANTEVLRRFHREIRLASQLRHPNIVRSFDADQVGGTNLMVMEYVEGTDLSRLVKQSGPLPIRQACDYIRQAALGLQHAHEQGLVHRDIKPSNLVVSVAPATGNPAAHTPIPAHQVRILDFGVARLEDSTAGDATNMTVMGCIVGTPDFMAPEQARDSHSADIRSDLYSLGCTLYFLLTGQVPFPGGTGTEKLLQHHMEEARPVEQLRPEVPLGLATVVRKLMAKRPDDRYQTPAELVAALSAALADSRLPSAITTKIAVPPSLHGAVTRKIPVLRPPRGRRRWAGVAALGLVMLLGGLAAAWALLPARQPASTNPAVVQAKESHPQILPTGKASQPDVRDVPPREQPIVLGDGQLRGAVHALAASGNGLVLASGDADHAIHLWDTKTWRERVPPLRGHSGDIHALALTADGRMLASGSADQTIKLWDVASARDLGTLKGHGSTIRLLAFSPDGRTLVSAGDDDPNIRLWDVPARHERTQWKAHDKSVTALAVSGDGQTLASAGSDMVVRLWDVDTGKERGAYTGHNRPITSVACTTDGSKVASGSEGGALRIWTLPAKKGHSLKGGGLRGGIGLLAFSPDGKRLAAAGGKGGLVLWDVDGEGKLQDWAFPSVNSLTFIPRTPYLAVGLAGTIQVLRADGGKLPR
jgi:hypothetical protein